MISTLLSIFLLAQTIRPESADAYNRRGAEHFKKGRITESVADFDRAIERSPGQAPHHWQRGISLYYAGRYEDCRKQFELHQTVNPNDVENGVWHYLCASRTAGVEAARKALLPISGDPRIPMMQIYAVFRGSAPVESVLAAAYAGNPPPDVVNERLFYAHLYLGLYYEAAGVAKKSREHIDLAVARMVDHYMGDVARVHQKLRR